MLLKRFCGGGGGHRSMSSLRVWMVCRAVTTMVATLMWTVADAYPSGPPTTICTSMSPTGHGTSTVSGTNPFTLSTNKATYAPGEQIQVTLTGASFIGFFVQARRRGNGQDTDTAVGTFGSIDTALSKTLNCDGTTSAWSHKTNAAKSSITATWTAPPNDEGPIAFRATVVQGPGSGKYWEDLYSDEVMFSVGGGGDGNTTTSMGSQTAMPTGTANMLRSCVPILYASLLIAIRAMSDSLF